MFRIRYISVAFPVLVVFMMLLAAAIIYADPQPKVTYIYYDREWIPEEILYRYENNIFFGCVQYPTESSVRNQFADLFYCFDTEEEASAFLDSIQPAVERGDQLAQELIDSGVHRRPVQPESFDVEQYPEEDGILLSSNHWALYSQSFHLFWSWMLDAHNGDSNNHSGVWSLWKDGNPNTITIWPLPNQGGGVFYQYSSTQYSLVTIPFGGGGGQSSRVAP